MALTKMPKVGDKVRYVGVYCDFLTQHKLYEILIVSEDHRGVYAEYYDDEGELLDFTAEELDEWVLVIPAPTQADAVNPAHYKQGAVEVIDYIDQVADGYVGKQAAYAANIIKYVSRAPYKNQAQDIRKAIWYAERLAGAMEADV